MYNGGEVIVLKDLEERGKEEMSNLSHKVRYCRERLGLTQEELSKLSGVSVREIGLLEDPELNYRARVDALFDLCRLFRRAPAKMFRARMGGEQRRDKGQDAPP